MPVVDIKGVGKAQFPDNMDINNIREFLRNKYFQDEVKDAFAIADKALPTKDARFGELGEIKNKNNSVSTEFSITENIPELGGWVNIPTLVKGQDDLSFLETGNITIENRRKAIDRAIERVKGGAKLPSYEALEDAVKAAESRSEAEKMRPYQNPRSRALDPAPQTAAPVEQSLVDKAGQTVADFLFDKGIISDRYRAQETGRTLSGLAEFLPGIGDATAGDEFGRAVAQGDKLGMGLAALGAIPVAGDVAKGGINKARKLVDEIELKYKLDIAPLQAEYRSGASPDRKAEILKESQQLRKPLDAAKSNLFRLENAATPKTKPAPEKERPNKTFKGKVFHQTAEEFDKFDLSKSADGTAWFTSDKKNFSDPSSSASAASGKAKILERNIELNKVAGYDELDKYSIAELRQQGYDGAVLDGDIQVFDPKAIKPAVQSLPMDEVKND